MSKQTSIDWLVNELKKSKHYQQMINEVHQNSTIAIDVIEQSKQMHKEEITDAYGDGLNAYRVEFCNRNDYFNKVYGGQDA